MTTPTPTTPPLDPDSDFEASKFSRGYVHHLFKAHEPLAAHIV